MNIDAIDLFCGAGGLTRGLRDAGVTVLAGFDTDEHCRYPYVKNNPGSAFHAKDVAQVTGAELKRIWAAGSADSIRLLAGCAPCQPFSSAGQAKLVTGKDPRYPLLDHFARLVRTCRPELVTMENVPRVQSHRPFLNFTTELAALGYDVWYDSVPCVAFGVPQRRRRLVLMASRLAQAPRLRVKLSDAPITVRDALAGLRALKAGEADPRDRIHMARNLDPTNLERIKHSKPGGTWHDWPRRLRSPCHIKESGASYRSVYSRMRSDEPSPTITTLFFNFGTGRFGHPTEHRAITPREAAILQSFPRGYEFVAPGEKAHFTRLGRMIGNAVPPKLGQAIGKAFLAHVQSEPTS